MLQVVPALGIEGTRCGSHPEEQWGLAIRSIVRNNT
jgi:hypothetical protein